MLLVDVSTLFKFPSAFLIELIFSQMGWRDHHNLDLSRPRTESGGKLHPRASLVTIGSDVKWSKGIVQLQFPQKEQPMTFLFVATMMLNLDSIRLHGGARLVTIIMMMIIIAMMIMTMMIIIAMMMMTMDACKVVVNPCQQVSPLKHFIIIILSYNIILYHHISLYHDDDNGCL